MSEDKQIKLLENTQAKMAEGYYKKYPDQVKALEESLLSKVQKITPMHIVAMGKQIDTFESYRKMNELSGTLNNLGMLPTAALDVIPAVMGQLPISTIASVQPIDGQKGIIHFKNVAAGTTKGNRVAGEVFQNPRIGEKTNIGYAGNAVTVDFAIGDGTAKSFTGTLPNKPTRNQFLKVSVAGNPDVVGADQATAYQADPSVGSIWGKGVWGTVVYASGVVTLHFDVAPSAAQIVRVEFQENYEAAPDVPKIESFWDSRTVEAEVFVLKQTVGMLQQYALNKQYGEAANDESTADLIRAINQEIFGRLLGKLMAGAVGTTNFFKKAPTGVSYFEHKMTYADQVAQAEATMAGNAGRGQVNVMVVGRRHAAVIAGLPGFKKLSDGRSLGAHIFGEYNGMTVVRVNDDALVGGNPYRGIGVFKGDSPFDAAAVYAPFMPLALTGDLPMQNPLVTQKAAATMAAVDLLVPAYVTNINVVDTVDPDAP